MRHNSLPYIIRVHGVGGSGSKESGQLLENSIRIKGLCSDCHMNPCNSECVLAKFVDDTKADDLLIVK